MKARFLALLLLIAGLTVACSDDDKDDFKLVSDATVAAFAKDFPGASDMKWEKKKGYFVVDFYMESRTREMEAWYDNAGKLYVTERDITHKELPAAVITALGSSKYADWAIDDIDEISREGFETIYVIEVEKGKEEVDLVYNAEGVLLREIVEGAGTGDAGDYIPANLPAAIQSYLQTNHPNAKIVDVDKEKTHWEVEIVENRVKKEIKFTLDNHSWIQTEWDVAAATLPEVVVTAIANSAYADWKIDDVDFLQNPKGEFYKIEFEKSGQKDVEVLFDAVSGEIVG